MFVVNSTPCWSCNTINVYEYATAYGIGLQADSPDHSLYIEGRSMLDALVADNKSAGYEEVNTIYSFDGSRGKGSRTVIIAPETNSTLYYSVQVAKESAYFPIASELNAIHLTTNKKQLSDHWWKCGVLTPVTTSLDDLEMSLPETELPVVIKPIDGCGSTGIVCAKGLQEVANILYKFDKMRYGENYRYIVQPVIPGLAASVAFLIGPKQTIPLRPTFQMLSDDGRFHYLGGQFPISPHLEDRAIKLGRQAVECVPGLAGYVGVDLILGDAEDGSQDYAIEINPRLTTSYVGLRVLADFNIAQAMIDVVEGRPVDYVKWKPGRVEFWPDGRTSYDPTPGSVWE